MEAPLIMLQLTGDNGTAGLIGEVETGEQVGGEGQGLVDRWRIAMK